VRTYSRLVYTQAFALLGDSQEAEDVTQECFLRAFRFRVRLREPEKFPQWLLTIARNIARDHYRRRHPTESLDGSPERSFADEETQLPLRQIEQKEACSAVTAAIDELPDRYREAITLRYLRGLDYRTICRRLSLSDGALRGILGRALHRLRDALERRDPPA
jgi:RNA polymerase sigma-70 factor (ECF subfamily)